MSDDRGRDASRPREIPRRGWWDVARRVKSEATNDNVSLVAAGVAFYGLLALFPALAALVTLYGLVSDPATISQQVRNLQFLPAEGRDLIAQQLQRLASPSNTALGLGLAFSLLLALLSASKGTKALVTAMNIAYDEREERGFLHLNALALAFTLLAIVASVICLAVIGGVPALLKQMNLGPLLQIPLTALVWVVLIAGVVGALAVLYRFGPSRSRPRWRWITPGSLFAAIFWALASIGFSIYVSQFGNYNATYGAFGAIVILLMWFWISALVVLLGAEVNAEVESQVARDTTEGPERPRGQRGAHAADTVGQTT